MSRVSLPEERLLAGKGPGADIEPVRLGVTDDEEVRARQRSQRVLENRTHYTNEERDRILAKMHLGV